MNDWNVKCLRNVSIVVGTMYDHHQSKYCGKTIMAGLIIKELKLRRIAKRILIVVPGHLRDQWIRELKDRFEETFTSVNSIVN
jgi:SNF2 family DNA or RNA helicase